MTITKIKNIKEEIEKRISGFPSYISHLTETKPVQWLLFFLLTLATTLLVSLKIGKLPKNVEVGAVVPYDIRADRDYVILDEVATQQSRDAALKSSKPVYTFDKLLWKGIEDDVKSIFSEARSIIEEWSNTDQDKGKKATEAEAIAIFSKIWKEHFPYSEIGETELKFLISENFSEAIEDKIIAATKEIMSNPIVANEDKARLASWDTIIVRSLSENLSEEGDNIENVLEEEWDQSKKADIKTVDEIREEVKKGGYLPESLEIDKREDRIAALVAASIIKPNFSYDESATLKKRRDILENIKVEINIKRGETIVRGGSLYTERDKTIIERIREQKEKQSLPLEMMGSFLIICTIYLVVYFFGKRHVRRFAPNKTDVVFMGVLMLVMLLLLRFGIYIIRIVSEHATSNIPNSVLIYAIPLAAGTMLVRFIVNAESASLFAVVLAAFTGIVMERNIYFPSFTLASSFAAAVAVSRADRRGAVVQAGVVIGAINIVVLLSIHFVNVSSVDEPSGIINMIWYVVSAILNGVGCFMFVLIAAPIAESVFGYTTDIKLLELANMNNPLLRELLIRAPGTFNHSHLVGLLAEAATEAIGANALLARVGALYHDIGKTTKPEYFIENLIDGQNPHESLSPYMSALIVASHVKEGIELARENKLPEVIVSMIPEHHGTKQIGFFYKKARESSDPALQKIDEKDFRYPGPKPRTREAGVLMLADSAEAAIRSLSDKNPTRIRQVVENVINKTFAEGELSNCELTLKDLSDIADAFVKVFTGIYHQRVSYPSEGDKIENVPDLNGVGKKDENGNSESHSG